MLTMPKPVEVFNGPTYKPIDCRVPIVTIKMAAAMSVVNSTSRCLR